MNIAVQSITRAIARRETRQIILKDDKAFDALYGQLQTALTNAWDGAMREGIVSALDRLRDLGAGKFTKEDGATIMRVLEASVGAEAIQAATRDPAIKLTDAFFRLGAQEVGQAAGVSIAFARPDLDALDVLKTGNLYWIGNSWNVRTQNTMAKILEDYFTEGMTREGLTARMAEDFAGVTERSRTYWEILADHTATKTREIGRVTGYERAGIDHVQVRAHMDEGTTEICRQMNGRIIPVTKMRAQVTEYLDAMSTRNEVRAKEAWAMHSGDVDLSGIADKDLPANIGSPPYHFRCRTITVAYFAPAQKWTMAPAPNVPNQTRSIVARWAEDHVAKRASFNSAISAKNAARYVSAMAQTKAHFDLGKLDRLASGSMITKRAKNAIAFYVDGFRMMGVNAKAFKPLQNASMKRPPLAASKLDFDNVEFGWFATNPSLEYIVRHEYGHWFHDHYRKEVNQALSDARKLDIGWPQMVSQYGLTNDAEWFAETFALYFEGPEQHHRIAPPVLKLLKGKDAHNDT